MRIVKWFSFSWVVMVDVNSILEPALQPGAWSVAEVQKWCQYFFVNFLTNHGLTGQSGREQPEKLEGKDDRNECVSSSAAGPTRALLLLGSEILFTKERQSSEFRDEKSDLTPPVWRHSACLTEVNESGAHARFPIEHGYRAFVGGLRILM